MFEKDMRLALLLDYYGDLLSERKREIMEMYYCEDLSLSEIAENTGISRQGVRESIKKSENELFMLESKLHLAQRFEALRRRCAYEAVQIESAAEALSDGASKESLLRSASFLKSIPI